MRKARFYINIKENKMDFDVVYSHSAMAEKLKLNINEVMRYMGQRKEDEKVTELIEALLPISFEKAKPRSSFVMKKLERFNDTLVFGNVKTKSVSLKKALEGCDSVVVFGMTLGAETDRLIASKAQKSATCHALSAIATEMMEEYADVVCDEIGKALKAQGYRLLPRFGVGYGDFELKHQNEILDMCEGYKRCGITTTDALMLVPTKSITGIMGVRGE